MKIKYYKLSEIDYKCRELIEEHALKDILIICLGGQVARL